MHVRDFESESVKRMRADLALALRAAAHHGLAEGVCSVWNCLTNLAGSCSIRADCSGAKCKLTTSS